MLNFIFYEQIYPRNDGYSAGHKVQTQKEKNNFLKDMDTTLTIKLQSQSGNSLTFISRYPDPSGCKIVQMDV